ncbi:hypothetical protein [Microbacterium sp. KNMS]
MLKRTIAARAAVTTAAVLGLTFGVAACAPSAPSAGGAEEPVRSAEATQAPATPEPQPEEAVVVPDGRYLLDDGDDTPTELSMMGAFWTWTFEGTTVTWEMSQCDQSDIWVEDTGLIVGARVDWGSEHIASSTLTLNEDGTVSATSSNSDLTLIPEGTPGAEAIKARALEQPGCEQ